MSAPRLINLDDAEWHETTMVVLYKGQRVTLSRARICDLLKHEDELIDLLGAKGAATPAPKGTYVAPDLKIRITHGSLSNRVKRVYGYSSTTKRLRAAQASVLLDALSSFDWQLPGHPNTKLDQHLSEILGWKGLDEMTRLAIETFLVRYVAARANKR